MGAKIFYHFLSWNLKNLYCQTDSFLIYKVNVFILQIQFIVRRSNLLKFFSNIHNFIIPNNHNGFLLGGLYKKMNQIPGLKKNLNLQI